MRCQHAQQYVLLVWKAAGLLTAVEGAIRFGDTLSRTQCSTLLVKLSHCTYPFKCAHGRPSAAPLFDMTSLPEMAPRMSLEEKRQMLLNLQDHAFIAL